MGWATSLPVFSPPSPFSYSICQMNLGVSALKKAVTAAIATSRTFNFTCEQSLKILLLGIK